RPRLHRLRRQAPGHRGAGHQADHDHRRGGVSDPPQAPAPAPAFPVPPEAFTPPGMDDVDRLHPPAWEWWDAIAVFVLWFFGLVVAGAVIGSALAGSSA